MIDTIIAKIKEQAIAAAPIGDTLKFVLDDKTVFLDGTGDANVVTEEDKEASCTITTSADTFAELQSGDLNPMGAVMSGKVKIAGDMGLAMKLQSLLG